MFVDDWLDSYEWIWENVGGTLGVGVTDIKLLAVLIGQIFVSLPLPYIKIIKLRYIYSLCFGIFSIFFIYRHDIWLLLIFQIIIHQYILWHKEKSSKFCMIGMFTFLSFYHLWRMWEAYGLYIQDFTLVLMNQTTKVTYIAWAVHDFYKNQKDASKLPPELKGRVIRHLPNMLEYLSYNFTFIGFSGPFIEYRDFQDYMLMERNYANVRISLKQFLANFRDLVLYQVIFLGLAPYFPFQAMSGPLWAKYSFSWKCVWILVAGWVLRARYYIAFSYGQVAADLSGISYDSEQDNNELYRNFEVWGIEWDQRLKKRVLKWNQSVQHWLNHVCYIRYKPIVGTSNAALAVFSLSAFWHGFYPSWYVLFSCAYCLLQIQTTGYKCREALSKLPTWSLPKAVVDVSNTLDKVLPCPENSSWPKRFDPWMLFTQTYCMVTFNFCGLLAQNLHHTLTIASLRNFYYLPVWAFGVYFLIKPVCLQIAGYYGVKDSVLLALKPRAKEPVKADAAKQMK
jgi:hypothetical protein